MRRAIRNEIRRQRVWGLVDVSNWKPDKASAQDLREHGIENARNVKLSLHACRMKRRTRCITRGSRDVHKLSTATMLLLSHTNSTGSRDHWAHHKWTATTMDNNS